MSLAISTFSRFVRSRLAVIVLFLLAAIPPLLVLDDRWFGNRQIADSLRAWWCRVPFLCGSAWQPYFLIVFDSTSRTTPSRFGAHPYIAGGRGRYYCPSHCRAGHSGVGLYISL